MTCSSWSGSARIAPAAVVGDDELDLPPISRLSICEISETTSGNCSTSGAQRLLARKGQQLPAGQPRGSNWRGSAGCRHNRCRPAYGAAASGLMPKIAVSTLLKSCATRPPVAHRLHLGSLRDLPFQPGSSVESARPSSTVARPARAPGPAPPSITGSSPPPHQPHGNVTRPGPVHRTADRVRKRPLSLDTKGSVG